MRSHRHSSPSPRTSPQSKHSRIVSALAIAPSSRLTDATLSKPYSASELPNVNREEVAPSDSSIHHPLLDQGAHPVSPSHSFKKREQDSYFGMRKNGVSRVKVPKSLDFQNGKCSSRPRPICHAAATGNPRARAEPQDGPVLHNSSA
ncbi:hypothetical protein BGZ57DRAFT_856587 [Hyaloscypha finlandica]|nr:hypothetical protein BGZ57DRAFT_856587 [Hyaloscypha finlandica]